MKKCIFAGTFDPPTLGHLDTMEQALQIFDVVQAAILVNPEKKPFFTLEERKQMLKLLCGGNPRVEIRDWQGVVVDLLREENTPFYVRGIRNTVDLEYENANFYANRALYGDVVTLYLPARQEHIHFSSTLAKNCIRFGKPLEPYVGEAVAVYIQERLKEKQRGENKSHV